MTSLPFENASRGAGETEEEVTREVLRLVAELRPLRVEDGRIAIPDDSPPELVERIRAYEGELLFAYRYESGPAWGRAIPGAPYNTLRWPFPKGAPAPASGRGGGGFAINAEPASTRSTDQHLPEWPGPGQEPV